MNTTVDLPKVRLRPSKLLIVSVIAVTASVAVFFAWQAGQIAAKAYLSQWLLQMNWQQRLSTGHSVRPWPGLDSYPVARLFTEENKRGTVVLDNPSGQALAFAPTLISPIPTNHKDSPSGTQARITLRAEQTVAIAGHRNTHLAFLEGVAIGDRVGLETSDGTRRLYQVNDHFIVDTRSEDLLIDTNWQGLLMITCYPFDTIDANGPLRLVVYAAPVAR